MCLALLQRAPLGLNSVGISSSQNQPLYKRANSSEVNSLAWMEEKTEAGKVGQGSRSHR